MNAYDTDHCDKIISEIENNEDHLERNVEKQLEINKDFINQHQQNLNSIRENNEKIKKLLNFDINNLIK